MTTVGARRRAPTTETDAVGQVLGITLDRLTKVYPNGVCAVDAVNLEIKPGEFVALVGPSGCGKTTLLRMIAGLEGVTSGSVSVGGADVTHIHPRARDIAMVFQNYALYPQMTVRENLAFGLRMRRMPKPEIGRRVNTVAETLGLASLMDRRPGALSGGQCQRVAMGRALVRQPKAFLMDEPLSNLDAQLRVTMRGELARLHAQIGVTTVYVTHDQVEAMTLGTHVAVMRDGVLQQFDTPRRLFEAPRNLFVAAFIGSPAMNLCRATIRGERVTAAQLELPLPPGSPVAGTDRDIILGIRPNDFRLAGPGVDPSWPRLRVRAEAVEHLGSEAHVLFTLSVPPVATGDTVAAADAGPDDGRLLADDRTRVTAEVDPYRPIAVNDTVELAIDHTRAYLFDPATGDVVGGPRSA